MAKKQHETQSDDDTTIALFLETYGRQLLAAAAALLLFIVAIGFYLGSSNSAVENDFIAAENSFLALQRPPLNNGAPSNSWQAALDRLLDILNRQTSLQARYDAPLAQLLIAYNKPTQAQPLMDRCWQRLAAGDVPHLREFGAITSLIDNGQQAQALAENQSLLAAWDAPNNKTSPQPLLHQYSALRGAFVLSAADPHSAAAQQQWQQLLTQLETLPPTDASTPLAQLSPLFANGDVTLLEYVQQVANSQKKSSLTAVN